MPTSISGTAGVTYPAGGLANTAGAGVGTTDTQTLTNKTLTTPTIATIKSAASATPTIFQDSAGTEIGTLCRAWVNFDGTSATPITPRSSFNVSSVTKGGTGNYTLNFTNAISDANYAATTGGTYLDNNAATRVFGVTTQSFTTTTLKIWSTDMTTSSAIDAKIISVAVFR